MRKIQLGTGSCPLAGWENYDLDATTSFHGVVVDIRDRLPFDDGTIDRIFIEQVIEHVTVHEAWRFLEEAIRVLAPGGGIRLSMPDIVQFWKQMTPEYMKLELDNHVADGTRKDTLRSMIFCHGHQMAWTGPLLQTICEAVGFSSARVFPIGESDDGEFRGIEGHGGVIGNHLNRQVSTSVEAWK